MSALDDLIKAAEDGARPWQEPDDSNWPYARFALEAFDGSLDAALRLHEALLPGWDWLVRRSGWCSLHSPDFESITWEAGECVKTDILSGMNVVVGDVPFPARAWLLSILRALKAQEGRE